MNRTGFGPPITGDDRDLKNRQSLLRFALMLGLSALLAATAPQPVAIAAFSALLLVGAVVAAAFAAIMREPAMAPHFTRWDEAAALLAASMLAGLFVDAAAVQEAIEAGR